MKVLIYTLTRDRLSYTKRMLTQLKNCGVEYDHVILDNGSKDNTMKYLRDGSYKMVLGKPKNLGLWKGIQNIIDMTNRFEGYDYVLKLDNDMEFPYDNWLANLINTYIENDFDVLSPFVEGVCNGAGGIPRDYYEDRIGVVEHVGGACLLTTQAYYDEDLPNGYMATGWDTWFCTGLKCGVVEDIHVKHMGNEIKGNEKYHERQRHEETIKY